MGFGQLLSLGGCRLGSGGLKSLPTLFPLHFFPRFLSHPPVSCGCESLSVPVSGSCLEAVSEPVARHLRGSRQYSSDPSVLSVFFYVT